MNLIDKIEELLPLVRKPGRYTGQEINRTQKKWDEVKIKAVLLFPDLYEIGMSHLGLHILYHVLNMFEWVWADRAYRPDMDMEALMCSRQIPLWGLESGKSIADFDIIGITLPYELCYSNIPAMLDLAGIPLVAEDRRRGEYPLVIGGGSCSCNPEPVADMFDAIVFGDGERVVVEIAHSLLASKERGLSKKELLEDLATINGVYVPSFYTPVYSAEGVFEGMKSDLPNGGKVKRRIESSLEELPFPETPLVPYFKIVHDRLGIEIARGCTRGCRFCQASTIYRPVRERSLEKNLDIIAKSIESSGWDELSLLSLSAGDYSSLYPLIKTLMDKYLDQNISISLPSLRVGTLTPDIMKEIKKVRKTGFTLAPEAGTDRMRRVINKGITEKELLETAAHAYENGWSNMKLYFMVGLPLETMDDVSAIAELARRVQEQGSHLKGRREVTVSVGVFVPKPHTPFQWEGQLSIDESWKRLERVKDSLKKSKIQVKWHDPEQSFLEGVFSRGDRRLLPVIIDAWRDGAGLDAWSDHLTPELYYKAARDRGIDLNVFLEGRKLDDVMPWDHLDSGVRKDFLIQELRRAAEEKITSDCRYGKCHQCGVCDFREIKPVTYEQSKIPHSYMRKSEKKRVSSRKPFFFRFTYKKIGSARLMSHLEVMSSFHRAARLAKIPVLFSGGFHPAMRFSFANPLPLGIESTGEEAGVALYEWLHSDEIIKRFNKRLPAGISLVTAKASSSKLVFQEPREKVFLVYIKSVDSEFIEQGITSFNELECLRVIKRTKKKEIEIDLVQAVKIVKSLSFNDVEVDIREDSILNEWIDASGIDKKDSIVVLGFDTNLAHGIKPVQALQKIFPDIDQEHITCARILALKAIVGRNILGMEKVCS